MAEPLRRPLNAFMRFSSESRQSLREMHSGASVADIAKLLGEAWRCMPADEKKKWEDKAARDKEAYRIELSKLGAGCVASTSIVHISKASQLIARNKRRCDARAERQRSRLLKRANVCAPHLNPCFHED